MKPFINIHFKICLCIILLILTNQFVFSQNALTPQSSSDFWSKVRFGGGLGLSFGDITNVSVSPSALYQANSKIGVGASLQYSYVSARNFYTSNIVGGSVFSIFNVVDNVQLSLDAERLRVSTTFTNAAAATANEVAFQQQNSQTYWTNALFVGGAYSTNGVAIGVRYNVLFDKNRSVYPQAFMPFVRVFF